MKCFERLVKDHHLTCVAMHASNSIIKFSDNTTVVGLITNNDKTAYREEVRALGVCCNLYNLSLKVNKTNEMIVDSRKQQREYPPCTSTGQQWTRWKVLSSSAYTSHTNWNGAWQIQDCYNHYYPSPWFRSCSSAINPSAIYQPVSIYRTVSFKPLWLLWSISCFPTDTSI